MDEQIKSLYEVSFLARSENGAATMVRHLASLGAEIVNEGSLNKMKLAYPIEGQESAYFGCIACSIPRDAVSKVHDAVRLDKEIMRVLILTSQSTKTDVASGTRKHIPNVPRDTTEPKMAKTARPETKEKTALSNELLEEKLEEIMK